MAEETIDGQFSDADEELTSSKPILPLHLQRNEENGFLLNEANIDLEKIVGEQLTIDNNSDEYSDDEDEDDDWYEWDEQTKGVTRRYNLNSVSGIRQGVQHPNHQQASERVSTFQPNDKFFRKYASKINVEKYEIPNLPSFATSPLIENNKKADSDRLRVKDKYDRATVEQVLDPRTRMILFKMLNRGIITEINGCISTGKEANVYHASGKNGEDRAIKIYKTSILVFKDRDRYVSGEFRFRRGYCKHNPRKMVRTWAEKEMRNLSRLYSADLPAPQPIILRSHVLVMDFIGTNGLPAPKLKDVDLSESKARELYLDCIILMRRMYWNCKLVHADLSEFNILFHKGKLCFIDVSQSVEHDHPHALEFLRKDCTNVNEFFRKKCVATMTVRELFDFITDPNVTNDNMEEYLEKIQQIASLRSEQERTAQEKIDEEVFKKVYIPQRLNEVIHYERDVNDLKEGKDRQVIYHTITGLKPDLSGPQHEPSLLLPRKSEGDSVTSDRNSCKDGENSDGETSDSSEKSCEDKGTNQNSGARPRNESPNSRRERKKVVKEAQRENRKTKVKKHVKKRKEKLAKAKKH